MGSKDCGGFWKPDGTYVDCGFATKPLPAGEPCLQQSCTGSDCENKCNDRFELTTGWACTDNWPSKAACSRKTIKSCTWCEAHHMSSSLASNIFTIARQSIKGIKKQ